MSYSQLSQQLQSLTENDRAYHRLLSRQLKRLRLSADNAPDKEEWRRFLNYINATYDDNDTDRKMIERSLTITSEEIKILYDNLKESSASKLNQERNKLQTIITSLSEGLCIFNAEAKLDFANDEAKKLLGERVKKDQKLVQLFSSVDASEKVLTAFEQGEKVETEEDSFCDNQGHSFPVSYSFTPLSTGEAILIFRDITERKRAENLLKARHDELERRVQIRTAELEHANQQLQHEAFHDGLTGIANRVLFSQRLEQAIQWQNRYKEEDFAVLFLDLDRFKIVNDSLGHLAGDTLLCTVAKRLENEVRAVDTVARLGGDEFTVLLERLDSYEEVLEIASRILASLLKPIKLKNQEVQISASIGIIFSENIYNSAEEVLRDADIAMYYAKTKGKAQYQVFDKSMREKAVIQLELETELRKAIEHEALQAYYQPIISVTTQELVGFEALCRWEHPSKGFIPPDVFIPIAEEVNLITQLDIQILIQACKFMSTLKSKIHNQSLILSANFSSQHFVQINFTEQLLNILKSIDFDPNQLRIEITEGVLLSSDTIVAKNLRDLRAKGINIQIDDFGTCYSSLSYLQRFSIDTLKIDRSFITHLLEDSESVELVKAIIQMSQNLGLNVIAEGVEEFDQFLRLQSLGCTFVQGFYFSKPMPAKDLEAYINEDSTLQNLQEAV